MLQKGIPEGKGRMGTSLAEIGDHYDMTISADMLFWSFPCKNCATMKCQCPPFVLGDRARASHMIEEFQTPMK